MIDTYTKIMLTIIAIATSLIAYHQINQPTFGDLLAIREIKDIKEARYIATELRKDAPIVYISGSN